MFLSLDLEKKLLCEVSKNIGMQTLNCIKCDFIVCMECATLSYKARYKSDKHFLTLSWGEEMCEKYWSEECENRVDTFFYRCNDCCTILHTAYLYMKPGQCFQLYGKEVKILAKRNISRPICDYCRKPCQGKIFTTEDSTACSRDCAFCLIP
ncbi:unnamed protein product [Brassica oleracea]